MIIFFMISTLPSYDFHRPTLPAPTFTCSHIRSGLSGHFFCRILMPVGAVFELTSACDSGHMAEILDSCYTGLCGGSRHSRQRDRVSRQNKTERLITAPFGGPVREIRSRDWDEKS